MIESKSRIPGEDLFEIKTDYDRVLEEVNVKGDVSASTLMKELNMKKDEFFYCYTILSDRKLIKLDYPVVGKLHLVSLNYHEEKKKEKKEKKEEKKNQKRENKNKGEKNE